MDGRLNERVISVILGGGAGSRLYPLTASRSKPAVPIAGKYRLVDIPISNCMNSGIHRIFVLTQFNSASLNRHIKNTYQFGPFSKGFVDIVAAEQTPHANTGWFQGTADAVRQASRQYNNQDYDYVLILSGDQLYQIDFAKMIEAHMESDADISIATIPVNSRDAQGFGIMKTNEENIITSFIEKPKADLLPDWTSDTGDAMQKTGRNYIASMGIYVFKRNILENLLKSVHPEATDFGKEIIPQSISEHKVISFQYEGYWEDIGNISSFFEANLDLTKDIPSIDLYNTKQAIFTRPRMLPTAKINGSLLNRAVIAEGSIIMANLIERSIIGVRSRIGFNTKIFNTYVMGNDYYETLERINKHNEEGTPALGIGENCYIDNAIIDKNVFIGNNVIIRGGAHIEDQDTDKFTVKDGIVVIKKFAVLNDGFKIGV